ncbi:MAG TPA: SIMPL domain-containing protein [Longimicrobiales bacterium]|nr:SIMPL domain-containing protein [Longimicrobiales bacterium]
MKTMILAALLAMPAALSAQQQPVEQPRTLTVNGTATVEKEPEQGVVLLAVESEAPGAREAAEANATKMSQIIPALRRAGVAERNIRTTSYELRPEYARQQNNEQAPRIAGYRAINMVQVTVDTVARMGAVIDAAISTGANRVANISFRLRDARAAHLEAVAQAMRNARREAEIIAEAAGEVLGPAHSIHTGGFAPPAPPPMPYARMDMVEMQQAAPTPIEAGTLTVMAHVTVVYRLADR